MIFVIIRKILPERWPVFDLIFVLILILVPALLILQGCIDSLEICGWIYPLRKHAYSIILKFLQPKKENFQIKNSNILLISARNIDCVYC